VAPCRIMTRIDICLAARQIDRELTTVPPKRLINAVTGDVDFGRYSPGRSPESINASVLGRGWESYLRPCHQGCLSQSHKIPFQFFDAVPIEPFRSYVWR
jgi:hypothetical protein